MKAVFHFSELFEYKTEFLALSMQLFNNWRIFKALPHGKGTRHERESVLQILRILKEEETLFDEWEREREKMNRSK